MVVEVVVVVALGVAIATTAFDGLAREQLGWVATLTGLGVLHVEVCLHVEGRARARLPISDTVNLDLLTVWTFAAGLLLSPLLAALHVGVVQLHAWWRTGWPWPVYQQSFSVATTVLAVLAADFVATASGVAVPAHGVSSMPVLAVSLAMIVYAMVDTALIAGAVMLMSARPTVTSAMGRWDEYQLEIAVLTLGAFVAVAMRINWLMVLLVLPPLILLHRSVPVRALPRAARADPKTGLLNARAWQEDAELLLRNPPPPGGRRAVLLVDLDSFKAVNDAHGRLAGDRAIAAVAAVLRSELRKDDLVGRFGGEEFVVLLAATQAGDTEPLAAAERIRRRVEALRVDLPGSDGTRTLSDLSASIGGAFQRDGDVDLRELLRRADDALLAAKRAGRNTVRLEAPS
ncbi:GGDEF domain-containing protein [Actinomycetes bacterium KLBMP 9759]